MNNLVESKNGKIYAQSHIVAELQQILNNLDEELIIVKEDKQGKAEVTTVSF